MNDHPAFLAKLCAFLLSTPQNKANDKQGVWSHQTCGEKTWGHLVVIIFVESSAHTPPQVSLTAQIQPKCSALRRQGQGHLLHPFMLPHKPLLGLDARPQHVLPLDHIWMLLDKLQVVRQ